MYNLYIYIYMHMSLFLSLSLSLYIYIYICICMYIYIYIYMSGICLHYMVRSPPIHGPVTYCSPCARMTSTNREQTHDFGFMWKRTIAAYIHGLWSWTHTVRTITPNTLVLSRYVVCRSTLGYGQRVLLCYVMLPCIKQSGGTALEYTRFSTWTLNHRVEHCVLCTLTSSTLV